MFLYSSNQTRIPVAISENDQKLWEGWSAIKLANRNQSPNNPNRNSDSIAVNNINATDGSHRFETHIYAHIHTHLFRAHAVRQESIGRPWCGTYQCHIETSVRRRARFRPLFYERVANSATLLSTLQFDFNKSLISINCNAFNLFNSICQNHERIYTVITGTFPIHRSRQIDICVRTTVLRTM